LSLSWAASYINNRITRQDCLAAGDGKDLMDFALPAEGSEGPVLRAYLLGTLDFDAAQALQKRLVYEVSGDRSQAVLLLCEHPPLITVGRQGSRSHFFCEPADLRVREWPVRWVNRGGGCLLHLPGQLAVYPIVALDQLGLSVPGYLQRLQQVACDVLDDFSVHGQTRPDQAGVWVGSRLIASVGVAVRDWVTYYGAALNVHPDLEHFRLLRCSAAGDGPMTSLERERRGAVRPALVRQRLLEHFCNRFAVARLSILTDHPSLSRKARHALASHS
jgi:lipoyl(octanoyl) transferase